MKRDLFTKWTGLGLGLLAASFIYLVPLSLPRFKHQNIMSPCQHGTHKVERDILPTNVRPTHYDLTIDPDFTTFAFQGTVHIEYFTAFSLISSLLFFLSSLEVAEASPEVKLNAKDLKMKKIEIDGLPVKAYELDDKSEVLTLTLSQPLAAGSKAKLSIEYEGEMNEKMAGFYRSGYEDGETGQKRFMGATQFEATDARKALPCWDEPAVKATFTVHLAVPAGMTGLSNMQETGKQPHGSKQLVSFAKSPIMSTYLLAWVIGDLDCIERVNEDGIKVRVWATRGSSQQGQFALDVACRTLAFFSRYFAQPYPLPKMDMVAIPDFSAGAMENWGLVTYRLAYLLFDDANSSLKSKQQVASVVAHELAHQWFGNLVTMEWWSDLWLNEGFASWVGQLAVDQLFPEWDTWTEFIVDDCQAGLSLDAMRSSHPIEVPVKNPDEIGQIFDSISYSKGASLIRQLVKFLGENSFRDGMRVYLERHKYGNAKTADLWAALGEVSGKPVPDIMALWTQRIGFPAIEVKQEGTHAIQVTQHRFLASGDVKPEEDETIWSVPLKIGTSANAQPSEHLLTDRSMKIDLASGLNWFKLNMGQAGFYRVLYQPQQLQQLGKAVAAGELSAADRIGLVADAFSMTVAGRLPISDTLALLENFADEKEFLVWSEISSRLVEVLSIVWEEPAEVQERLKTFIAFLFQKQAQALGFDPKGEESDLVKMLRPLVIGMSARCGDKQVLGELQSRFKRYLDGDHAAVNPNLRGVVFSNAIRFGGEEEFEAVLKQYQTLKVVDQKLAALGSLAASQQPAVIARALELSLNTELVRPQDVIYIFRTAGANPAARRACWEFTQKNWSTFTQRYGQGGGISLLGRLVSCSSQELSSEADAQAVETFFKAQNIPSIERSIAQSVEKIRSHSSWLSLNRDEMSKWLATRMAKLAK